MDKNEILEKSKRDNRNGDEWQKDVMLKGYRFSMIAAAVLLGVLCLVRHDIGYLIVITIMSLCRDVYGAAKLKRKVDFILVIVDVLFCGIVIYNHVKGVW